MRSKPRGLLDLKLILAIASVIVGVAQAEGPAPQRKEPPWNPRLEATQRTVAERQTVLLARQWGIHLDQELAELRRLARERNVKALRERVEAASKTADDVWRRSGVEQQKDRSFRFPAVVYRLPAVAFECLASVCRDDELTATERLAYARALSNLEGVPVRPYRVVEAFAKVTLSRPTPEQHAEALVGQIRALVLTDQIERGSMTGEMLAAADTLRKLAPKSSRLAEGLTVIGNHFLWCGDVAAARPLWREAVEQNPTAAVHARRQLEREGM